MTNAKKPSIRAIAKQSGADRSTVAKLIAGITDEQEALALVTEWKEARDAKGGADTDPETGLSWFKAKLREDTLTKRRENEIAEKKASGEWVSAQEIGKNIRLLMDMLERLPEKAQSEAGLNGPQTLVITRLIDEARKEAAEVV
jgi:hypothetical protein